MKTTEFRPPQKTSTRKPKTKTKSAPSTRKPKGSAAHYRQKFDDDFRALFTKRLRKEPRSFGVALWSSVANVAWYHKSDTDNTRCTRSFRGIGAVIASMLGHGSYLDWYCSGPDGVVSKYIAKKMAARRWRYEAHYPIRPPSPEEEAILARLFGSDPKDPRVCNVNCAPSKTWCLMRGESPRWARFSQPPIPSVDVARN